MLDSCGAPFELIDGYINKISVSVPWSALLNDSCCMDIQGLELTIAMKQRSEQGEVSWQLLQCRRIFSGRKTYYTLSACHSMTTNVVVLQLIVNILTLLHCK